MNFILVFLFVSQFSLLVFIWFFNSLSLNQMTAHNYEVDRTVSSLLFLIAWVLGKILYLLHSLARHEPETMSRSISHVI
jgi:hypothetical protein